MASGFFCSYIVKCTAHAVICLYFYSMRHSKLLLAGLFVFFCSAITLNAQEIPVRLKMVGPSNEPLSFATIVVMGVPDTMYRKEQVADSAGTASFQLYTDRPYRIRVSHAGYVEFEKSITVRGNDPQFTISVPVVSKSMSKIVVTASRPLIRQEDDKTIVDPENLAAVSTNAYEILEKTPGLFVDQDGNIYISSTTPATVYINGREQKMSAADIATMLKNLPPNAIASIEILRTPSARYDASGSGGVVNVILKKGVRIGLTGSVTTGMNQGRYGNQFLGVNINNNNGAWSTYLNLQYGRRNSFDHIQTNRFFSSDTSQLSQDALTRYTADNYYAGYGVGYQLNKKWELNYDGRFSRNTTGNNSKNASVISKGTQTLGSNVTDVRNDGINNSINQGLNARYKIDSAGSEWTTDLSFTYSPNTTHQLFNTGNGNLENQLHFFSAQTNLLKKISSGITVETGLKSTNVRFNNVTDYFRLSGSTRNRDTIRSGAYRYREQINAAYIQASRNFSGIIIKLGMRPQRAAASLPPWRCRWRITSWLEKTQVGHAFRRRRLASVDSIFVRRATASQGCHRNEKLNDRCSSSSLP